MIKKNLKIINTFNILADIITVTAAFLLAGLFTRLTGESVSSPKGISALFWGVTLACLLCLTLSLLGFYNMNRLSGLNRKLSAILIANAALFGVSTIVGLTFIPSFFYELLFAFFLISTALLCIKYIAMRFISGLLRSKGYNIKHVLIIGTGNLAVQYARDIQSNESLGYHIIGYAGKPAENLDAPLLGDFESLEGLLHDTYMDDAVIALEAEETSRLKEIITLCERNGIKYCIIPFYNDIIPDYPQIEIIGRSKLIRLRDNRLDNYGWAFIKRSFDFLASLMGIIVLSPLLLILALGVKLSSPGPILFKQERVGYNRKIFTMYKFRSMVVNSHEKDGWTKDDDPRKTKFGTFIRKYSLDELAQLFNVLKGDMSLVGPRPELPHFVEILREDIPLYMLKHRVRPGITGWAQVNGYRGDTSIEKRIEYDLWYIDHWSVFLDIKIFFMTVFGGMINSEKKAAHQERKVINRLLITASGGGHLKSFHLPYIQAFRDMGWEVHLAYGGQEANVPYATQSHLVPFEKSFSSLSNFRAAAMIRKLVKEYDYDLIITHTSLAAFFTRFALVFLKKRPKTVNMVHGYLFEEHTSPLKALVLKAAELFTAKQTDLLITMNDYDYKWALKHQAGKRVEFVKGIGLDTERLRIQNSNRVKAANSFGIVPGDFVLIYPAEFSGRKNQLFLIEAMPLLPPNVKLLLPGNGDKLDECKEKAAELHLLERVIFPGYITDIAQCFDLADMAVSSSFSEGLPFNIMEAMYIKLPIVASRIKGHTDLIEDNVNGLLFDLGDTGQYIEAVKRILENNTLLQTFTENAAESIKPYLLEEVKPKVMEEYLSVFK